MIKFQDKSYTSLASSTIMAESRLNTFAHYKFIVMLFQFSGNNWNVTFVIVIDCK